MDATNIIITWARDKFKISLQRRDAAKILLEYMKLLKPGDTLERHHALMEQVMLRYISRRQGN